MNLGVHLGHWGLGVDAPGQLLLAQEAERLGYESISVAEAYGSDAATVLAWLAAGTSTIKLGSAVFQMPARSAAMTAMTAATIDQLSNGRMVLGLGASGPQVAEGWHGQRFSKQLARTRDYVAVVRMALARERVQFAGETLTLPLPDGPGKALKLTIAPVQERMPILLAAIGPRNTQLAGEIADGWIPTLAAPERIEELRGALEAGARLAGRSLDRFLIAPQVYTLVHEDLDAARDAMRPVLALYIGGMGSREQNFYNELIARSGFEREAREVQELYLGGRTRDAAAALPAALIDNVCLCGPPARVRARLADYAAAGVGTLGVSLMTTDPAAGIEQLRVLVNLLAT